MFYIVNKQMIKNVGWLTEEQRRIAIYDRPTPWKVFLIGFLHRTPDYGLICLPDGEIERFYQKTIPLLYAWQVLCINGGQYAVREWNFFDMCKFCIESFQYGFFARIWRWRWEQ